MMDGNLLKQAESYHNLGWCVIPLPYADKRARIKWKQYQSTRPDLSQLQQWFTGDNTNIAVILGKVSEHLTCRDFDKLATYDQWAANCPDYARLLPTVETGRGRHVYFRNEIKGIHHIEYGEIRSGGGYCLLPPSIHPSQKPYRWINPPDKDNLITIKDLSLFSNVTEQTEQTEQTEAIVSNEWIKKAISDTLPEACGTRNQKIFEFVRTLKSLSRFEDVEPTRFKNIVRLWHKKALPFIRTEDFEETWIDFLIAWERVILPKGDEPMTQIYEKAISVEPPSIAIELYPDNQKIHVLVALCQELQRASGEKPFYLSCRTAGKLLDIQPMTASRWFYLLEKERVLKTVVKGGRNSNKATRFKYLPPI